jgi:hypothetical protein
LAKSKLRNNTEKANSFLQYYLDSIVFLHTFAKTLNQLTFFYKTQNEMEQQKVDMFMMMNNKYLPESQILFIREHLLAADDSKESLLHAVQFKDPTIALILSLLTGNLGIDRFYIGDTGLGIGKLITCGGFGLWTIIDWFLIMNSTREKNLMRLMSVI